MKNKFIIFASILVTSCSHMKAAQQYVPKEVQDEVMRQAVSAMKPSAETKEEVSNTSKVCPNATVKIIIVNGEKKEEIKDPWPDEP